MSDFGQVISQLNSCKVIILLINHYEVWIKQNVNFFILQINLLKIRINLAFTNSNHYHLR